MPWINPPCEEAGWHGAMMIGEGGGGGGGGGGEGKTRTTTTMTGWGGGHSACPYPSGIVWLEEGCSIGG